MCSGAFCGMAILQEIRKRLRDAAAEDVGGPAADPSCIAQTWPVHQGGQAGRAGLAGTRV
jgi:hypothetical protein